MFQQFPVFIDHQVYCGMGPVRLYRNINIITFVANEGMLPSFSDVGFLPDFRTAPAFEGNIEIISITFDYIPDLVFTRI
jgi:hypothetical protein